MCREPFAQLPCPPGGVTPGALPSVTGRAPCLACPAGGLPGPCSHTDPRSPPAPLPKTREICKSAPSLAVSPWSWHRGANRYPWPGSRVLPRQCHLVPPALSCSLAVAQATTGPVFTLLCLHLAALGPSSVRLCKAVSTDAMAQIHPAVLLSLPLRLGHLLPQAS